MERRRFNSYPAHHFSLNKKEDICYNTQQEVIICPEVIVSRGTRMGTKVRAAENRTSGSQTKKSETRSMCRTGKHIGNFMTRGISVITNSR